MNIQRTAILLTVINLALLIFLVVQARSTPVLSSPIMRTQGLELVDGHGQTRARLQIKGSDTVELDLFDQTGNVRVKLGGGENGSGLFLADETTNTGVQIIARRTGTTDQPATTGIIFTGADGLRREITP
jgi:hypothetical protein